jgi:hypothetical protein
MKPPKAFSRRVPRTKAMACFGPADNQASSILIIKLSTSLGLDEGKEMEKKWKNSLKINVNPFVFW